MALFQPTNITPSSFSGAAAGTVDVTQNLTVSWQVNGNSPLVAYQIRIMQNTSASTQVLNTGKVTLSSPFYGVNYKGEVQYFSATITASQMSTAGMTNGYANGYKLEIKQWWDGSNSITQTSPSYFITRRTPTLSMASIPNPMPYRAYTFTATYSQAQGDGIEWMQWQITLNDGSAVYDTGKIYGTGEVKMDYDGFISDRTYRVRCTVETVNGIEATTGWQTFDVSYQSSLLDGTTFACPLCNTDAVEVTLPPSVYITGKKQGTISYTKDASNNNILVLSSSSDSVVWDEANTDPLSLDYPYSVIVAGRILSVLNNNTILTITYYGHSASLIAKPDGIYFEIDGTNLFYYAIQLYGGEKYRIVIGPNNVNIEMYAFIGSPTYPSETLYPNTNLYPSTGVEGTSSYSDEIDEWQSGSITSISISGPNEYDFIWIYKGELSSEEIENIISNDGYEPQYDENTEFLALFNNTLEAGSLSSSQEVQGFVIYRRDNDEAYFYHLADLPIGTKSFRDYSAVSQNTYQYYVYAATESFYTASSLATEPVTPVFWNYTLMCCSKDDEGVYHLQNEYRFALDVASGSVGNNNNPQFQQNFTRYPIRQPVNSNYRSGTLSAFIGTVKDGKYVDSVKLMKELYELSTSTMTKFLKTRKGEIFMVDVSAPIQMQIGDNYVDQPAKISLPWVEVGDATNAPIVSY